VRPGLLGILSAHQASPRRSVLVGGLAASAASAGWCGVATGHAIGHSGHAGTDAHARPHLRHHAGDDATPSLPGRLGAPSSNLGAPTRNSAAPLIISAVLARLAEWRERRRRGRWRCIRPDHSRPVGAFAKIGRRVARSGPRFVAELLKGNFKLIYKDTDESGGTQSTLGGYRKSPPGNRPSTANTTAARLKTKTIRK